MADRERKPRFTRGEALTADKLNAALDWVERRTAISAGPGLTVSQTAAGVAIGLAGARARGRFPARITQAPPFAPIDAAAAVYTAVADAPHGGVTFTGAPTLGRPVHAQNPGTAPFILPARVGDYCEVIVRDDPANPGTPKKELLVETECPFWNVCTQGGA